MSPQDAYLLIKGKGRKEREVSLGSEARTLLHRYLTRYRPTFPLAAGESLMFVSRTGASLNPRKLDAILYTLRDRAGLKHSAVRISAHTFRHTFATRWLEAGGDVFALSKVLGHTTINTTMIYVKDYQQRNARRIQYSLLDDMTTARRAAR